MDSADLQRLAALYHELSQKQPVFGGSQQLLLPTSNRFSPLSKPSDLFDNQTALFIIFERLTPRDLLKARQVSRSWNSVASSESVWKPVIKREMRGWTRIHSSRNPVVEESWMQKYITYHKPMANSRPMIRWPVINIDPPKVLMLGPGLESERCQGLVREMFTDSFRPAVPGGTGNFEFQKLHPGLLKGLGAGLEVKLNHTTFRLVVLYTNTKEHRLSKEQKKANKMYDEGKLLPGIKTLLKGAAALVYVLDSTDHTLPDEPNDDDPETQPELSSFLEATPENVPLLVLSCYNMQATPDLPTPTVEVVEKLGLSEIDRPWVVQQGEVTTLTGVREGFETLLTLVGK